MYEAVPIALAPVLGNPVSLAAAGVDRSLPLQEQVCFNTAVIVCGGLSASCCSRLGRVWHLGVTCSSLLPRLEHWGRVWRTSYPSSRRLQTSCRLRPLPGSCGSWLQDVDSWRTGESVSQRTAHLCRLHGLGTTSHNMCCRPPLRQCSPTNWGGFAYVGTAKYSSGCCLSQGTVTC